MLPGNSDDKEFDRCATELCVLLHILDFFLDAFADCILLL